MDRRPLRLGGPPDARRPRGLIGEPWRGVRHFTSNPSTRRPRASAPAVDLGSPRSKAGAHDFYRRLREESPVSPVTLPYGRRVWLITRYDDVLAALRDPRFVKDPLNAVLEDERPKQPWI